MTYPPAVKRLMRIGFLMSLLAIISMIVNISTITTLHNQKIIKETVVEYRQVLLATDSQRIQLFIDELLTPKSAACFRAILKKETNGYNAKAVNPASGASGVGQLLDSTYRNLGLRKTNDPLAQVVATLAYISRHYSPSGNGSVCNAWSYWQRNYNY